jgi:hypothetical protein
MIDQDPYLPEGVTHQDIDNSTGDIFDPNLCEHEYTTCMECPTRLPLWCDNCREGWGYTDGVWCVSCEEGNAL